MPARRILSTTVVVGSPSIILGLLFIAHSSACLPVPKNAQYLIIYAGSVRLNISNLSIEVLGKPFAHRYSDTYPTLYT